MTKDADAAVVCETFPGSERSAKGSWKDGNDSLVTILIVGLVLPAILFVVAAILWLSGVMARSASVRRVEAVSRVVPGLLGTRCGYCRTALRREIVACTRCSEVYDAECAREAEVCAAYGCGGLSFVPCGAQGVESTLS